VSDTQAPTAGLRKLAELIKDIRVAMMHTYRDAAGAGHDPAAEHVRPMYTQKIDPDKFAGELFFFTDFSSAKVSELRANPSILLTYSAPGSDRFVVARGVAVCERDVAKAKELWNIHAKGWWPEGPTSSELAVLRVQVNDAEYWDGPNKLTYAVKLLSAVASGTRMEDYGEHGRV
jgi:general stress protein 26